MNTGDKVRIVGPGEEGVIVGPLIHEAEVLFADGTIARFGMHSLELVLDPLDEVGADTDLHPESELRQNIGEWVMPNGSTETYEEWQERMRAEVIAELGLDDVGDTNAPSADDIAAERDAAEQWDEEMADGPEGAIMEPHECGCDNERHGGQGDVCRNIAAPGDSHCLPCAWGCAA